METAELEQLVANAELRNPGVFNASRERYVIELAYKAGQESGKYSISTVVDVGNDAFKDGEKVGTKKVVDWIKTCTTNPLASDDYGYYIWKAKLKAKLKDWDTHISKE